MKRLSFLVVLALSLAIIATPLLVTNAGAAGARVTVKGESFSPTAITVRKGSSVTWVNPSGDQHTVTFYSGPSKFSGKLGSSYSHKFTAPGVYHYRCLYHSSLSGTTCHGMCGTVKVTR